MMTVLYIVVALILIFALLSFMAPKEYHVSRNITVNKPLEEVFDFVCSLRNQAKWSPWEAKDPDMKKEYFGIDSKIGFTCRWEGNKDVGMGEQEIKRIVENDVMESELRFIKPWKSESDCYIKVDEVGESKTRVTWGFSGKSKFPMNIMTMFWSMDKAVGKDFEEGLNNLKEILEQN